MKPPRPCTCIVIVLLANVSLQRLNVLVVPVALGTLQRFVCILLTEQKGPVNPLFH